MRMLRRLRPEVGAEPVSPQPVSPQPVSLQLAWSMPDTGWMLRPAAGDRHLGKLGYAACDTCRIGIVKKISVYAPYDRHGLGRALLARLRDVHPALVWHTNTQYPTRSPSGGRSPRRPATPTPTSATPAACGAATPIPRCAPPLDRRRA